MKTPSRTRDELIEDLTNHYLITVYEGAFPGSADYEQFCDFVSPILRHILEQVGYPQLRVLHEEEI